MSQGKARLAISQIPSLEILQGTLVLTDRLAERGQIAVEDGLIQEVLIDSRHRPTVDYGDEFISPGFIDLHVHGIAGMGVTDANPASIGLMARRFAAHGVTAFMPTTVTESLEATRRAVSRIRDYMAGEHDQGARVLGIHLEGPWISREFKGMQNEAYILPPEERTVLDLLDLAGDTIKLVSLAPELPGADAIICLLRSRGVYVSIAHTAATYEQVLHAVDLGATHVTHCFNAMTGLHHRLPGVAGAAMLIDDLYAELIGDGIHIHPAVMRLLIRVKGRERVMLVTDALSATELADGVYELGGKEVFVRDGQARLADGTLASSTLTMDAGVRNLMNLCQISLVDAVYMASTTPAESMGLDSSRGKLLAGYDADLAVLDAALQPRATWVAGIAVGIR
jgi:N-acetylglucosamine-6-phosphate deacetylase